MPNTLARNDPMSHLLDICPTFGAARRHTGAKPAPDGWFLAATIDLDRQRVTPRSRISWLPFGE
jgi:hypothetical protein